MELLRLLESIRTPFLDILIGLITRLGEETANIAVICAILWCINKTFAYRIGIAYLLSGLTVQGMKIIFRIERPWVIDPSLQPVQSALHHATGYSFPSGHTQAAAAMLGSLGAWFKQKPLKALFFSLAVLVAFSRMYLGVHTLLDVSVSLLIVFLFIVFSIKFFSDGEFNKKREIILCLSMVAFASAVIIIAAVLYANGTIAHAFVTDCLKAAGATMGFAVGMYIEKAYINFSVKTKGLIWQVIKYVLGIAGVMVIKEGLKLIVGTGLVTDTIRYFLMILWVSVFFPLIIKKFFQKPD